MLYPKEQNPNPESQTEANALEIVDYLKKQQLCAVNWAWLTSSIALNN